MFPQRQESGRGGDDRPGQGDRPFGDRPGGGFGGGGRPSGPGGGGARPRRRGGGGGRVQRRKICPFCADNVDYIDYKDASRLRRYVTERAKIESRRKFGTCAKHQRALETAIKRARHVALLPFTGHHG